MNSSSQRDSHDRISHLIGGPTERTIWHAPRLFSDIKATPGIVMGNRAFMRAWAARRAAKMSRLANENASPAERWSPASSSDSRHETGVSHQPDGTTGSSS